MKDYTALLLNCYVKMKMNDKINELTSNLEKEVSFDIKTLIEICRKHEDTLL